jgi:hypothetical protein
MRDLMEVMMYRQFFGVGESWTQAVFLAGVFLVILFRRDQIVSPYMFRVSIILFVLSFILPVVLTGILQLTVNSGGRMVGLPQSVGSGSVLPVLMSITGPVLLGLSVVFCVLSMLPKQSRYPAPPDRPREPHPLD